MNPAAFLAEKWTLEVDAKYFGAEIAGFKLLRNVFGDAFDCVKSVLGGSSHRRRHNGCGSMLRDLFRNSGKGFARSFHHVPATRAMDVHINEAGNRGGILGAEFLGAGGEFQVSSFADTLNFAIPNQDRGVADFGGLGDFTSHVGGGRFYCSQNILTGPRHKKKNGGPPKETPSQKK